MQALRLVPAGPLALWIITTAVKLLASPGPFNHYFGSAVTANHSFNHLLEIRRILALRKLLTA